MAFEAETLMPCVSFCCADFPIIIHRNMTVHSTHSRIMRVREVVRANSTPGDMNYRQWTVDFFVLSFRNLFRFLRDASEGRHDLQQNNEKSSFVVVRPGILVLFQYLYHFMWLCFIFSAFEFLSLVRDSL